MRRIVTDARVLAICWAIWKARNKACFDKKKVIQNLVEIICPTLMRFWAGLYAGVDKLGSLGRRGQHNAEVAISILAKKKSKLVTGYNDLEDKGNGGHPN